LKLGIVSTYLTREGRPVAAGRRNGYLSSNPVMGSNGGILKVGQNHLGLEKFVMLAVTREPGNAAQFYFGNQ
jgi:hypothetical protein